MIYTWRHTSVSTYPVDTSLLAYLCPPYSARNAHRVLGSDVACGLSQCLVSFCLCSGRGLIQSTKTLLITCTRGNKQQFIETLSCCRMWICTVILPKLHQRGPRTQKQSFSHAAPTTFLTCLYRAETCTACLWLCNIRHSPLCTLDIPHSTSLPKVQLKQHITL